MNQDTIIGDQPIECVAEDVFGYFTKSAAKLADEILVRKSPLALSITAGWGEGKTSMLNLIVFCIEYYLENQHLQQKCIDTCHNLWKTISEKEDYEDVIDGKSLLNTYKVERVLQNIRSGNTRIPVVRFNAWKYHEAPHIAMLTVFAESIGEWVERVKLENMKEYVKEELQLGKNDYIEILKINEELYNSIFEGIMEMIPADICKELEKRYKDGIAQEIRKRIEKAPTFERIFCLDRKETELLTVLISETENIILEKISQRIWEIGDETDELDDEIIKEIIEEIDKKIKLGGKIDEWSRLPIKEEFKIEFKKLRRKVRKALESKDGLMDAIHSLGLTHDKIIRGLSVASTLAFGIPIPGGVLKMAEEGEEGLHQGKEKKKIEKDEIIETLNALNEFDKKLTREGVLSTMKIERVAKELIERAEEIYRGECFRVVLMIDDLDRALAEHIFKVFETIKTYLDIKGLAIVAAYSPEYVERALDKVMKQKETIDPKKYLEKLFQINHRIERRQLVPSHFLRLVRTLLPLEFVKKKVMTEEEEKEINLMRFLARLFLKIINSLEISPRNLKRILMKAEEIRGHLPSDHQQDVCFMYASFLYSLFELCAPKYIEILKIRVIQEEEKKLESEWTIETIMSLVNMHEIEEEERKVVETMSFLKMRLPDVEERFSTALVTLLVIMRTGEVLKSRRRLKSSLALFSDERGFITSMGTLLVLCLDNGIPLKIKNVIGKGYFLLDSCTCEGAGDILDKSFTMIICSGKTEEEALHLFNINFSAASLWELLDKAIRMHEMNQCNGIKVVGIVFGLLDGESKERIFQAIKNELEKLSPNWRKKIKFCITDLPTLFESLTDIYKGIKIYKSDFTTYMAAIAMYMEKT